MARWVCPQCGRENEGNFCPACGNPRIDTVVGESGEVASGRAFVEPESPAQASPYTVTFETGRHYKVHKSYVWLGPLVAMLAVLFIGSLNNIPAIIQGVRWLREDGFEAGAMIVAAAVGGVALLFGVIVCIYALAYRNMSYVFDEREFSFYSGIITKRRVHLPYARVQSVNHRASIIQRLAGVCSVSIDSAGGASNKALRVPYLRLETAERMRVELFVRKAAVEAGMEQSVVYDPNADSATVIGAQAEAERARRERAAAPEAPLVSGAGAPTGVAGTSPGAFAAGKTGEGSVVGAAPNALDTIGGVVGEWRGAYGGQVAGLEAPTFGFGLTNRELLLTSASHGAPLVVAITVALTVIVVAVVAALMADTISRSIVALSIPLVLGSALLSWLVGVLGTAISYGNFRARRRGSRIEVERGLLQREFSGIDIARVQSIEIRQSLIRRLIGYCEVSLGRINAGGDEGGKQNSSSTTRGLVIHPFVRLDRVDEILDGLAPELRDRPQVNEIAHLPAPALRRSILRRCVWYNLGLYALVALGVLVAIVQSTPGGLPASAAGPFYGLVALFAVICVVYTIGRAVGAVIWARGSGYAWNRSYLLLLNDGLSVERSIIPRQKIQAGSTRDNPFQRRLSLTGISAVTAAGTHSTAARLIDVPAAVGAEYLEWLKPRH